MLIVDLTANSHSFKLKLLLLGLALLSGIIFLLNEKHKTHKLLEIELFKNKQFIKLLGAFFLLQYSSLSMSYLIPNVLEMLFKQSPSLVGLLVLPAAVIDAVLSVIAGIIYDKTTPNLPIISGCLIVVITFLSAGLIKPSVQVLVLLYICFMVGLSLSYSNIMTYSLSQLPKNLVNDGNVVYMTAQSYSGAIGIAISASIISSMQAQSKSITFGIKQGLELNFVILFLVAILILILGITALKNIPMMFIKTRRK